MDYSRLLDTFRTSDPLAWTAVYRQLPTWLGIACAAFGALLILFGNTRILIRLVAAPAAAGIGYLSAPEVALHFGLPYPAHSVAVGAALGLGILGLLIPSAAVFLAAGLPAGSAAGNLAGATHWLFGFVPGFLAAGSVAVAALRIIGAIVSSSAGAWLFVVGLLAALRQVQELVAAADRMPLAVLAAVGSFALAGVVFQLFLRKSRAHGASRSAGVPRTRSV